MYNSFTDESKVTLCEKLVQLEVQLASLSSTMAIVSKAAFDDYDNLAENYPAAISGFTDSVKIIYEKLSNLTFEMMADEIKKKHKER